MEALISIKLEICKSYLNDWATEPVVTGNDPYQDMISVIKSC